ncbi:unnamed protein product [Zymoseptoria tritici ST99CH_3D1]|nr:unnamed protein product [Zymoseptoria tritici ST99CH_3D1]
METEQQPDVVARQQTRLNTAARTAPPEARNSVQELATELEEIRKLPVIPKQRIRAFFNKLATAAFDVKGGIALCHELHDIGYILRQNLVEVREQADENVKDEDNGGIEAETADFEGNQKIAENIQKEDTAGVEGEVASSDPIERDSNGTNGTLGGEHATADSRRATTALEAVASTRTVPQVLSVKIREHAQAVVFLEEQQQ